MEKLKTHMEETEEFRQMQISPEKSETLTTVCERREDGFFGMSGGFIGGTGFRFGWFRGA